MKSKRGKKISVQWTNDPESLEHVRALFPGVQVEDKYKYGELSIFTAKGVVLAHTGDRIGRGKTGEPYIIKSRKE